MLFYTNPVYLFVCISVKSAFFRTIKSTLLLHNVLYNIAQNVLLIHTFFETELFPTSAVQQRQLVYVIWCCTLLAGWSACLSWYFGLWAWNILKVQEYRNWQVDEESHRLWRFV